MVEAECLCLEDRDHDDGEHDEGDGLLDDFQLDKVERSSIDDRADAVAGIMKKYSIKAMPHDSKMMKMRGQSLDDGTTSGNLSCPYQAKVMKTLEAIRSRMV